MLQHAAWIWRHVEACCRVVGADGKVYELVSTVISGDLVRKIERAAREMDESEGEYVLAEEDDAGGLSLGLEDINDIVRLHSRGE